MTYSQHEPSDPDAAMDVVLALFRAAGDAASRGDHILSAEIRADATFATAVLPLRTLAPRTRPPVNPRTYGRKVTP